VWNEGVRGDGILLLLLLIISMFDGPAVPRPVALQSQVTSFSDDTQGEMAANDHDEDDYDEAVIGLE